MCFCNIISVFNPTEEDEEQDEDPMDAFFPEALAGFIMVVTEEGDMIFLTENVNKHIGIAQVQHVSLGFYCKPTVGWSLRNSSRRVILSCLTETVRGTRVVPQPQRLHPTVDSLVLLLDYLSSTCKVRINQNTRSDAGSFRD